MALAVLQFVTEWIENNIVKILKDQSITATDRLTQALVKINELYNDGKSTCILRALSMDSGMYLFKSELKAATAGWIESFYHLGKDFGMDDKQAHHTAISVLTKIQGSLVVSKMLNDIRIFKHALDEIRELYIER